MKMLKLQRYMLSLKKKHFLFASLLFVFLLPNFSFAAPVAKKVLNSEDTIGFSVEPAISHVSVGKGMVFRSGISIRNQGTMPVTFIVRVFDFEPKDEYGGIKIIGNNENRDDPIYAAAWFSLPREKIVVPPKQKFIVPYSILVPDDASSGGRSVVFVAETIDGNTHSQINSICFLTVPGDAKESLEIKDASFSPFITGGSHGSFHLELKNNGKTHVRPSGKITVRNMFGGLRGKYDLSEDNEIGTIIPSAKKSIDYKWQGEMGAFDFGLWNAKIELNYGIKGAHSVYDRVFFIVLPWKAILLSIIILGGAIYFFLYSMKKFRKEWDEVDIEDTTQIEKKTSFKLLIIPFISGLLLAIVLGVYLYSTYADQGVGSIEKIQMYKK